MISPDHRIAIIYKDQPDFLGVGGFLVRAVEKICQIRHFYYGEEPEGFDEYWYIDDGPTYYMEPRYRPASYYALDMVVKPFWYLDPIEHYFERCKNFDNVWVTSTDTKKYCDDRGLQTKLIGFAADPGYHRPVDFPKDRDWVAIWHNCEGRVEATRRAYERFPKGQWAWVGNDMYSAYISRARCALNWLRGDIVNMRTFEVMACGTPLIQTRHRDMLYYGFVENEHYLGFDGIDEMLDKIDWVLNNPVEAEQIAIRARAKVLAEHTYHQRVSTILHGIIIK
jgi:hypothetical protein